ncbi:unnamed protein product [Schistocephalus solidus]|uniref:Small-subunit processome Utp12 domain-containing protein n=1 Tax=Schistocephalus solidus TaxID=70667 RepID=A0A3P7C6U2_SCHSO|nr:unnamed protein product [Schistocephalus solidus]
MARNLPLSLVIRSLVPFLARQLEPGRSRHAAFYVAWADAVLHVHAGALRRSLTNVARPRNKLQLSTATDEQAEERLKQPGVLLEHREWRAFQASLVRLQSSLDSLKGSLLNRLEGVDAVWSYLSAVADMAKGPGYPLVSIAASEDEGEEEEEEAVTAAATVEEEEEVRATELPSPAPMEDVVESSPAGSVKRSVSNATPEEEFALVTAGQQEDNLETSTRKKRKAKKKGNLQHESKTLTPVRKTKLKKAGVEQKIGSKKQFVAIAM